MMRTSKKLRLGAAGLAVALTLSLTPVAFAGETDADQPLPPAWTEGEPAATEEPTTPEAPAVDGEPAEEPPAQEPPAQEPTVEEPPALVEESLNRTLLTEQMALAEATGNFAVTGGTLGTDYKYESNTLTILTGTALTIDGTATTDVLVVEEGIDANLTFDGLSITAGDYRPAVAIGKNASLTLTLAADGDATAATLIGGKGRAAIEVPKTAQLTIAAASTGTLNATAGANESLAYPAAIGASAWMEAGSQKHYKDDVGTITINGGTVNATAGNGSAAGIGAACTNNNDLTSHGDIIINSGTVTAKGDPGIGARFAPDKDLDIAQGSIEIHGGAVKGVYAGSGAGGILSTGTATSPGSILIDGGTVSGSSNGEAVLGGDYCTVTIRENAVVTIERGINAGMGACIGGRQEPIVNIEGGTVTATGGQPVSIGNWGTQTSVFAGGEVNISGGTVRAEPNDYNKPTCGIGGNTCAVNISGGRVTAKGSYGSVGIGSSRNAGSYRGTVTITGGHVEATGSRNGANGNNYGAGIGTAADIDMDPSAKIVITGGTVIAKGGSNKDGVVANGIGVGRVKSTTADTRPTGANYFTTGQPGNALIVASSIGDQADKDNWSGVIFDGTSGAVYADPTLAWDGEIPEGYTLENGSGRTLGLAEGVTLTVGGTVNNSGVLENDGTLAFAATGAMDNRGTVGNHGTLNIAAYGTLKNSGTFDNYGTLDIAGAFVNIGEFNWYGVKTEIGSGTFNISTEGNVVNYASKVVTTVDTPNPSYGDQVTFTTTISRRDNVDATLTAGGKVDFFADKINGLATHEETTLAPGGKSMTATYTTYMTGKTWQAGKDHTVTASYSGSKGTPTFQLDKFDGDGVTVTVAKKALDDSMIAAIDPVIFTGSAHTPTPVVEYLVNGIDVITPADYTVSYASNTNAGTATVIVTATTDGNYSGSASRTFTINKAAAPTVADTIKNLYFNKAHTDLTLNVAALLPENKGTTTYEVNSIGGPVTSSTVNGDGLLTYSTQVGEENATHTITVTAEMENYENATASVVITLKDKTPATITGVTVTDRPYNGQPAAYTGTPTTDQVGYIGGFDYQWSALNGEVATPLNAAPVNAGTYRLTVSIPDSQEVYMGSANIDFTIDPATVTVTPGTYAVTKVYDGNTTAGTPSGALAVSGIIAADGEAVTVTAVPGVYPGTDAATGLTVTAALTLEGTGNTNYALAASTLAVPASITPKAITITAATVENRPYDGTTVAQVTAVTFAGTVAPLTLGTDYTAVGRFESTGAGDGKSVAVTVTLLNTNYTLANTATTATANITKATAGDPTPLTLDVANKYAYDYSVNLPTSLPALGENCTFGTVGYAVDTVTDDSSIFATQPSGSVTDGILNLSVKAVDSETATTDIATVTATVTSENYADFTVTLKVSTVNRKVPAGTPTVQGKLIYGQPLSGLKLAGEMKDGETVVPGVFSWSEGESRPTVDTTQAVWVFTPTDASTYLTVSGKAAITVEQALPAGTPTASIRESGKTLADAGLAGDFTNPHSAAQVAGTLVWDDPTTTAVSANRSFGWTFTPEDRDNYKAATGKLTPWQVSSGGGGGGGGSAPADPGVKNPDGSTTNTATDKKTGTVTETTKWPDGSQTVVQSHKDGSSTVEMKSKDGASSKTEIATDGKIESTVTLTEQAVKGQQGKLTLPMPQVTVQREAAAIVKVQVPAGETVKVEIPTSGATAGTVAILVLPNGEEQIVKSSVATDTGVILSLHEGATIKIVDNSKSFGDVPTDHWGTEAIQFTTSRELFQGVGTTEFAPTSSMTRGMLMTVLARYDGQDTAAGETWYSAGMEWAKASGISDGANPDGDISREQLAVMLYRYAGTPEADGALEEFADGAAVSDYAADAMKWAVQSGIVSGKDGNALDPLGSATRAEVAAMLQRFVGQSAT